MKGWLSGLALCLLAVHAWTAPVKPPLGEKGAVVVFTTMDCPVANALIPAVQALQREFEAQGFAFCFVEVNGEVAPEALKEHAATFGISAVMLRDPQHALARRLGATRTPEAFLLAPDGRVLYHGRINDLYHAPGKRRRAPTREELRDAIVASLTGKEIAVKFAPPVGCVIADFAEEP